MPASHSPYRWTHWTPRHRPLWAAGMALLISASSLGVTALLQNPWWGAAAGAGVMLASWQMWVPVRFEINERGLVRAAAGIRQGWPWSRFERCLLFPGGLFLVPAGARHRLDWAQGVLLPWSGHRREILRQVRRCRGGLGPGRRSIRRQPFTSTGGSYYNGGQPD